MSPGISAAHEVVRREAVRFVDEMKRTKGQSLDVPSIGRRFYSMPARGRMDAPTATGGSFLRARAWSAVAHSLSASR